MSVLFSQSYEVREALFLEPGVPIEGQFAVAEGDRFIHLVEAVEEVEKETTDSIIGIIPAEFEYGYACKGSALHDLISQTALKVIVTFGSTSRSEIGGDTHLSIAIRDLGLPFCFAQKPAGLRGRDAHSEELWRYNSGLNNLHSQLGSLVLSRDGKRIVIAA